METGLHASAHSLDAVATAHPGWDALSPEPLLGGIAVAVRPGAERGKRAWEECLDLLKDEPASRPAQWTATWQETLRGDVANIVAGQGLPGARFSALSVPRFVHGQSQGICDLFGAWVERQEDGNYFVHPLPPDARAIDAIEPRPLDKSMYWGAIEWIRYAHAATRGRFACRNPVMTGPFDTANYLLGTTRVMDWVYSEPAALHRLLEKITTVIIGMLEEAKKAAGGALQGDGLACMRNAFCLCSECRSLVSADTYEEFEAPYLARIGRQIGPYGIHSCGSWERTVPSALRDPNLRAMNGQVRENDLALLCKLAQGGVMLSIGPSKNLPERYTWRDTRSFLEYILASASPQQPVEISIDEPDLGLWAELFANSRRR